MKVSLNIIFCLIFLFFAESIIAQENKIFGPIYNGIQLATDQGNKTIIINKHGVKIIETDSIDIDLKETVKLIQESDLPEPDRKLIARVLLMYGNKPDQMREVMNLAKSFPSIPEILLQQYDAALEQKYGAKKLKKLKKSRKE